jgi:hypothetical protein
MRHLCGRNLRAEIFGGNAVGRFDDGVAAAWYSVAGASEPMCLGTVALEQ